MARPRVRPLPKTGDADYFDLLIETPTGAVWKRLVLHRRGCSEQEAAEKMSEVIAFAVQSTEGSRRMSLSDLASFYAPLAQ